LARRTELNICEISIDRIIC